MGTFQVGSVQLTAPDTYQPQLLAFSAESPSGAVRRAVVIARDDVGADASVDDYKQTQIKQLGASSAQFSVIKVGKITVLGTECPLIDAHQVGPGGVPVATLICFVKVGETIFTLSGTDARGAAYDAARPEFVRCFESFKAEPKRPRAAKK